MANTYISLNIHIVFSTKNRKRVIKHDFGQRLWPYMGGIAKQNKIIPMAIGGAADHVHMLLSFPGMLGVSKAVQLIKSGSSKWVHENFPEMKDFAWQIGFSAFSVSPGRIQRTINYINNQEQHHQRHGFQDEYLKFLRDSGIDFDERYVMG